LASPYYPSDRRFLDPIYLDLADLPGEPASQTDLADNLAIDYPAVWALKARALEKAFAASQNDPDFVRFVAAGGQVLERFAAFQAIAETRPGEPWRRWLGDLHDPASAGVRSFIGSHRLRVRFHQFLQWLCERRLAAAAHRARGLELGFCRDLAVGAAPDGAEVWSEAHLVAHGASIGAPPDPLGPLGQVWGLPPFNPHCLKADGYRSLIDLFAANMRHAGALRIDHVMGLARQFWIPEGAAGSAGAYVSFPLQDLLGQLALESARARCLIIGEDLGTVPEGLRETLAENGALSYRVLTFERDGADFKPPDAYPTLAWACVSTHDLPPLAGWWRGLDIAERVEIGLMTSSQAETALADRLADRTALIAALVEAKLANADLDPESELTPALAAAIHGFVARTPSILAVAQAEDLAGERVAINLPGTDRERPNWRRRIGPTVETLFDAPMARMILDAMRMARPSPTDGGAP
jgi:4-alpha-glucanotransferase